jgi:glycosyltransferase involved in cell wall biosynthesis
MLMPAPDRIALLTNFILPYRIPVLRELVRRSTDFQIFVSPLVEAGTDGTRKWGGLPVRVQRSLAWRSTWQHPHRFTEPLTIQIPYDTVSQLARFDPDVIISGEMGLRTLQAAAFAGLSKRRRLVLWATLSEATEQGRGFLRPLLRRALLHSADAVMVNGSSGGRYVGRFGIEAEKVFRVPQTTDVGPFLETHSDRPAATRHRLLYCGRLIELKGLIPFLSRLAAWAVRNRERQVEFWIAGDGPLRSAVAEFACPKNVCLRLLGNISYDRLPEVYANAGILAFPTLADEWGLVVVEAMAAGLPVLGSLYSQAVEDLVTDGATGWTFRPDRTGEVDAGLDRALGTDVSEIDAMGARARSVARKMTPSEMADRIMDAVDFACTPDGRKATWGSAA